MKIPICPPTTAGRSTSRLAAIETRYQSLKGKAKVGEPGRDDERAPGARDIRQIAEALDDQGRWVSRYAGERLEGQPKFRPGSLYLSSAVFSRNLETLSRYLAATADTRAGGRSTGQDALMSRKSLHDHSLGGSSQGDGQPVAADQCQGRG